MGTKWIFRNKLNESSNIIGNKARVVAQGYNQIGGIDFKKTFAPVAWLAAIRMTLAYASFNDFTLYQMNVKSAFLNGLIEEVYVEQPPSLLIIYILTMYSNWIKLFMIKNKLQELGMIGLINFLSARILLKVR